MTAAICPVVTAADEPPVCRHGYLVGYCPFGEADGPLTAADDTVEAICRDLHAVVRAAEVCVAILPATTGHATRGFLALALSRLDGEITYYEKCHRRAETLAMNDPTPDPEEPTR